MGFGNQGVIHGHADPLSSFLIEDDHLVAGVAVFAKDDGLEGELDAVGIPHEDTGVTGALAGCAVFVINGGDAGAFSFDEVELGDDAKAFAGEGDGADVDLFGRSAGVRRGEAGRGFVDSAVLD